MSSIAKKISRAFALAAVFGAALLIAHGAAVAGTCVTAPVEETFDLPDGTAQPPGRLSLCVERRFSPVQSLHEVSVNGMPVELALSRNAEIDIGDDARPAMIFSRSADGRLGLVGYTVPARDHMKVYSMRNPYSGYGMAALVSADGDTAAASVVRIAALTN